MMHTSPRALTRGISFVRMDANDPKALIEALHKAFKEFREENDQALEDLRKNQTDIVRTEKVDRINAAVGELQALAEKTAKDVGAMLVGPSNQMDELKSRDPIVRKMYDKDYTAAFESYYRSGGENAKLREVKAALDKGAGSEGGYLAPIEWDRTITNRLILVSPMRQVCGTQTISTAGYSKVFNLRGTGSGWVGETAARPETTGPGFATLNFTTGEIYANPSATQQILDDALIDLENWIAGEVDTEFAYQEGLAFISGNGTNKPDGLLTYAVGASNAAKHPFGAVPTRVLGSATVITGDDLLGTIYALPSIYTGNARFLMNRGVQGQLRTLKDTTGRYLWQPAFVAGQPPTLLAFPITEIPGMPNPAINAIAVAFGDFQRGYLIIDRIGMRVLRDPYTNKPYVMFYTTKRVGGGVVDPQPMIFMKMAAA